MDQHSAPIETAGDDPPLRTTLLQLVIFLSSLTESEEETLELALAFLSSGRVQLTGSFRDCCHEVLG